MHKKGIIIFSIVFALILLAGGIFLLSYKPMTVTEKLEKLYSDEIVCEMKFDGIDEVVTLELYPNLAPKTVKNFVKLVKDGYYDGLDVHRVVGDMIIQAGDGKKTSAIKGEFASNGFENPLKHEKGVISMARTPDKNSASSQFFIVVADAIPSLDGEYASFGMVTDGIDVVTEISHTECVDETPIIPPVIEYIKLK